MIGIMILELEPKTAETLLYIACGGLISALVYLYINNKKEVKEKDNEQAKQLEKQREKFLNVIKEKDDAILKINETHKNDIKESNKDYKYLVDKFSEYMGKIESLVNAR